MIEFAADHRRDASDFERPRVEDVQPGANDALHRLGQREPVLFVFNDRDAVAYRHRALLEQGRAHLFEEKRIAASALVQPARHGAGHLAHPERGLDDRGGGGEVERLEAHERRRRWPAIRGALIRAARHDQRQREGSGEIRHAGEGRTRSRIRPVPVFDDDEERSEPVSAPTAAASASSSAA